MMGGFDAEKLKPMVRPFVVGMDVEIAPLVRVNGACYAYYPATLCRCGTEISLLYVTHLLVLAALTVDLWV